MTLYAPRVYVYILWLLSMWCCLPVSSWAEPSSTTNPIANNARPIEVIAPTPSKHPSIKRGASSTEGLLKSSVSTPSPKPTIRHPLPTTPVAPVATPVIAQKTKRQTPSDAYYQVNAGETLYAIGRATGYGYEQLARWNQLSPPYTLQTGQRLKLASHSAPLITRPQNRVITPIARETKLLQAVAPTVSPTNKAPPALVKPVVTPETASLAVQNQPKKIIEPLRFQWPLQGRISRSFVQSNQQGIDIESLERQKSVVAAAEGQVVYTGQGLSNLKNLIIIQHNTQYLTAYSNNSHILVKDEQYVKKGQIIADLLSDSLPLSILHFQIRKNGVPVNPLLLLPPLTP